MRKKWLSLCLVLLLAAPSRLAGTDQPFTGIGPYVPPVWFLGTSYNTSLLIDATGEIAAVAGPVWFPARTGSKTINKVHFRFGAVTKAGGSGLKVSLQNVSLTASPMQPDGTADQFRLIANGEASFASNTWYTSALVTSDGTDTGTKRSVAYGELLAVALEYNTGGRLGTDSAVMNSWSAPSSGNNLIGTTALYTGAWANQANVPIVVLEFSDGTFGTFTSNPGIPASAINSHSIDVNMSPDEYALEIKFPFPVKVDGAWVFVSLANTSDFEVVLYSGTTALQTVAIDASAIGSTGARYLEVNFPETALTADTLYRLAIRPTTTNDVSAYSVDVANAAFLDLAGGGQAFAYSTRADQGSWSATTTTRRLLGGVRISSLSDGAGGGGGSYTFVQ